MRAARLSVIPAARVRRTGGVSLPVAVFVCGLAMLAIAVVIIWRLRPANAPHSPPAASNPDQPIAALSAEFATPGGALITARLAPLHADAARQTFESVSMRERFALAEGQPWRLSLRYDSNSGADATPPAPLALGAVEVRDDEGVALSSIPSAVAGGEPADPLRALLVAPSGNLQPGQAVDWVLWGRAPGAQARLSGLAGVELTFQARSIRRSELSLPLARLDRDAATNGKNGQSAASEDGHAQGDDGNAPDEHH